MKKLLLASSILASTAGFASAEVALSGSARMGVVYDGALDAGGGATYFSSRVRIVFTASGETDGGLTFGASMRADQTGGNDSDAGADEDGDSNGDSTVFISGAFGKLTMGDVGGAADALVGQTSGVGYGPNDGRHEIGFIGTTKTAAYYEYSTGAFTVGLGAGQAWIVDGDTDSNDEANIAVKYAAGAFSVALGFETTDAVGVDDLLSLKATAAFGPVTLKARVSDSATVGTPFSVSADWAAGPLTVTGVYTDFDITGSEFLALGAAYDLGGGASLAGMVGQTSTVLGDDTVADLGVKFAF